MQGGKAQVAFSARTRTVCEFVPTCERADMCVHVPVGAHACTLPASQLQSDAPWQRFDPSGTHLRRCLKRCGKQHNGALRLRHFPSWLPSWRLQRVEASDSGWRHLTAAFSKETAASESFRKPRPRRHSDPRLCSAAAGCVLAPRELLSCFRLDTLSFIGSPRSTWRYGKC